MDKKTRINIIKEKEEKKGKDETDNDKKNWRKNGESVCRTSNTRENKEGKKRKLYVTTEESTKGVQQLSSFQGGDHLYSRQPGISTLPVCETDYLADTNIRTHKHILFSPIF